MLQCTFAICGLHVKEYYYTNILKEQITQIDLYDWDFSVQQNKIHAVALSDVVDEA